MNREREEREGEKSLQDEDHFKGFRFRFQFHRTLSDFDDKTRLTRCQALCLAHFGAVIYLKPPPPSPHIVVGSGGRGLGARMHIKNSLLNSAMSCKKAVAKQ